MAGLWLQPRLSGSRPMKDAAHPALPLWSSDSVASLVYILWQLRMGLRRLDLARR